MPYTKTAWVEGGAPGVSAANLNKIEAGIAQAHWYGATTNAGNAYAVTLSPAPISFAELTGIPIRVQCNANATAALTINVNGLGAKAVKSSFGVATATWKAGSIYTLVYNGTDFILQGEGGSGNATPAQVLAGATYSNDNGPQTGAMPNNAGDNAALASSIVGTMLKLRAKTGFTDGVDDTVTITDPDFIAANFRADKNVFGLQGSIPIKNATNGNLAPSHHSVSETSPAPGVLYVRPNGVGGAGAVLFEGDVWLEVDDPDFIAANILAGKDIFGLAGSLALGKKFASGQASIPTSTMAAYIYNGGTNNRYFITVSGINFTPSIIFVCTRANGFSYFSLYRSPHLFPVASGNIPTIAVSFDNAPTAYYLDGTNSYVNGTGFRIPYSGNESGTTVDWLAIE